MRPLNDSSINEPEVAITQTAEATKNGKELLVVNDKMRLASSAKSSS